jgi:hypothetical protein
MASVEAVKQYLAHWFQLGKKVVLSKNYETLLPNPIFAGSVYSPEFDECWQKIARLQGRDCYLEGTTQTIAHLLTPLWNIAPCALCSMPIPKIELGVQEVGCPCSDLPSWPNYNLPLPRPAINAKEHLKVLQERLSQGNQ